MLLEISKQSTRIVLILWMILGTIGNVLNLNLLILTRHKLRKSTCTFYLIAASFNNLLAIYACILNRLLIDGYSIDVGSVSNIVCKLRIYVGYICLALSPYFFILACFDQYCSSSTSIRLQSWSNKTTRKRLIFGVIILAAILYSHMAVFFHVQQIGDQTICFLQQGIYNSLWRIFYLVIYCFFPCICMSVLCLLILKNIRLQSRQIRPASSNIIRLCRHADRAVIRLLFSHFITQLACVLPFAIINLLVAFISDDSIIISFLQKVLTLPLFATYATNFYVYTVSSAIYRREFIKVVRL